MRRLYKWTDEEGNIHYSDMPPGQKKVQEIDIQISPSQPKSQSTIEQLEESKTQQPYRRSFEGSSAVLKDLGPLPENISSKYLITKSTGITIVNWKKGIAQYSIMLRAKPDLPYDAYLEAHFDNPKDSSTPLVVGKLRKGGQKEIFIMSPEFQGLKCWNYEAVIYVYRDKTKSQLLGVHLGCRKSVLHGI
jgi:hypothetical protein